MNSGAPNAGDSDDPFAEVDLHLVPPVSNHRRDLGCTLDLTMRREHALQGPQWNVDVLLGEQTFDDDAVTRCWSIEQRERSRLLRSASSLHAAGRVRVGALADTPNAFSRNAHQGDSLCAPSTRGERAELLHDLGLQHGRNPVRLRVL